MKFTDEDLAKLRNELAHTDHYLKMTALITRLEAAEKCCMLMWISDHPIDESSREAYEAWWRTSAGK